jgi:hypothetical protein
LNLLDWSFWGKMKKCHFILILQNL